MKPEAGPGKVPPGRSDEVPIEEIVKAVRRIQHGYVQIVVQDNKVIQIDTHEKKRLDH